LHLEGESSKKRGTKETALEPDPSFYGRSRLLNNHHPTHSTRNLHIKIAGGLFIATQKPNRKQPIKTMTDDDEES
jgi:hypothetical protein